MSNKNQYEDLLREELVQRADEGCDITDILREKALSDDTESFYKALPEPVVHPDFPFNEPERLEDILAECDFDYVLPKKEISFDSISGAWTGRCAGCALGKPFECFPFTGGKDGLHGWRFIYEWYSQAGKYPIRSYAPKNSPAAEKYDIELEPGSSPSFAENIKFMQSDDDIRYMMLALLVLQKHGFDFTPADVGRVWLSNLPIDMTFTAERQAYINASLLDGFDDGDIFYISHHNNPYREWIGAQIRIDVYGYAAAGDPKKAAIAAAKDALFSHTKNGVYGAMFFAAVIAAAFVEKDINRLIDIGLSCIPRKCRLRGEIEAAREIALGAADEKELAEKVVSRYPAMSTVHTINNAALCTAALVWGNGDFEKSVTTAVLGGLDTDCNGATVGSVAGAINGFDAIPDRWKAPLNDTVYSSIAGFHPIKISDCAKLTEKLRTGHVND